MMRDETSRHLLTTAEAQKTFVMGGNATFTLVSKWTGARFTYKAQRGKEGRNGGEPPTFVRVMTGTDNESDYEFIGTVFPAINDDFGPGRPSYRHGKRSRISPDAPSAKAIAFFTSRLFNGGDLSGVEVWHEGRCGRCGRKLTTPSSLTRGVGPECAVQL